MARSISKWTIDEKAFSMSLDELASTQLPEWNSLAAQIGLTMPKPPGYVARRVDDFSPEFDLDGAGVLSILPFSELGGIIQNGDIIVFMEPKSTFEFFPLIKQRGWHAEIAFRRPDGTAVQCAPWSGESEIQEHPCNGLQNHRRYYAPRWNLHIFRISPSDAEEVNLRCLLQQVPMWRQIYGRYNFPPEIWQLDPVDFGNVVELESLACQLIRGDSVPDMFCMQWVHAILSLALNVPLSKTNLSRLGVLDAYMERWPDLGFCLDNATPLGFLPILPYTQSDLLHALMSLYLKTPPSEVQNMLPMFLKVPAIKNMLSGAPDRTILPIAPFSEYRKPNHTGTVRWEYVATSFADAQCRLQ